MNRYEIGCLLEVVGLLLIILTFWTGLVFDIWWISILGFIIWIAGICEKLEYMENKLKRLQLINKKLNYIWRSLNK